MKDSHLKKISLPREKEYKMYKITYEVQKGVDKWTNTVYVFAKSWSKARDFVFENIDYPVRLVRYSQGPMEDIHVVED